MTATILDRPATRTPERPGPSLAKLTLIEMRKFVDTRAGYWLLIVIGLLSAAVVAIQLIWGDESANDLRGFLEPAQFPVGVLLPVLGVLTVTTEWSQRTALTTFTLVPKRSRILVAKLVTAVIFSVFALLVTLLAAAIGTALAGALGRGDTSWSLPGSVLGQGLLFQVLGVVMGVGFGMLLLNTPVAIVTYFVIPMVFTILVAVVASIRDTAVWLDVNGAMEPLSNGSMMTRDWQHLATSSVLWIVVPLVLGAVRLMRREVK